MSRSGASSAVTEAVSCVSPTFFVAVGRYIAEGEKPLVESWNGTEWSIVPSPERGTGGNALNAVSCRKR